MDHGILGILDCDEEYAYHLMSYMNRKENFLLEARIFTNIESIIVFLENHIIEVLLLGEITFMTSLEIYNKKEIKQIFYLSSSNLVEEESDYLSIYKYQSTENLIKDVMSSYLEQTDSIHTMKHYTIKNKKVISVYSPCGGSGKTTTTFLLGYLYAQTSHVLIVNLESIAGEYKGISLNEHHGTLSDFIYYVKEGKKNISYKLSTMIVKIDNIDYLLPVDHYEDLYQLEPMDMQKVLKVLIEESEYDYIIFDIGILNKSIEVILEASEHIYMPSLGQIKYQDKWKRFIKFLELDQCAYIKEKIIDLKLPYDHLLKEDSLKWDILKKGEVVTYIRKKIC